MNLICPHCGEKMQPWLIITVKAILQLMDEGNGEYAIVWDDSNPEEARCNHCDGLLTGEMFRQVVAWENNIPNWNLEFSA